MPSSPSRRSLPVLAAALLLLTTSRALAAGQIGDPAADFSLQNLEGGTYTMSQFTGNAVVFLAVIGYG
jgi:hypothetical protein